MFVEKKGEFDEDKIGHDKSQRERTAFTASFFKENYGHILPGFRDNINYAVQSGLLGRELSNLVEDNSSIYPRDEQSINALSRSFCKILNSVKEKGESGKWCDTLYDRDVIYLTQVIGVGSNNVTMKNVIDFLIGIEKPIHQEVKTYIENMTQFNGMGNVQNIIIGSKVIGSTTLGEYTVVMDGTEEKIGASDLINVQVHLCYRASQIPNPIWRESIMRHAPEFSLSHYGGYQSMSDDAMKNVTNVVINFHMRSSTTLVEAFKAIRAHDWWNNPGMKQLFPNKPVLCFSNTNSIEKERGNKHSAFDDRYRNSKNGKIPVDDLIECGAISKHTRIDELSGKVSKDRWVRGSGGDNVVHFASVDESLCKKVNLGYSCGRCKTREPSITFPPGSGYDDVYEYGLFPPRLLESIRMRGTKKGIFKIMGCCREDKRKFGTLSNITKDQDVMCFSCERRFKEGDDAKFEIYPNKLIVTSGRENPHKKHKRDHHPTPCKSILPTKKKNYMFCRGLCFKCSTTKRTPRGILQRIKKMDVAISELTPVLSGRIVDLMRMSPENAFDDDGKLTSKEHAIRKRKLGIDMSGFRDG